MGVIIDKRLTFKKHTDNALRRIRKFLTVEKVKILVNAFTDRRFSYVLLMWMFCGKTFCSEIEKNHHRTLEVIYSIDGSYNNFLLVSNSASIHLQFLGSYLKVYLKSIQNLCGRSLSTKSCTAI